MEFVPAKDKATAIEYLARHGAAAAVLAGGTAIASRTVFSTSARCGSSPWWSGNPLRGHVSVRWRRKAISPSPRFSAPTIRRCVKRRLPAEVAKAATSEHLAEIYATVRRRLISFRRFWCTTPSSLWRAASAAPERSRFANFISGSASTGRLSDELLIGVDLDGSPPRTANTYIKVGRRGAMEAAIVGLAVRVTVSDGGHRLDDIRIAFGGIAPKAFRATGAESILRGQSPTDEVIRDAAAAVLRQAAPADDVFATAGYRIGLVPGILARAVKSCVERARHLPG
jgi:CO dehydrogenase flavoprotein C-terminal domain